MFQERYILFRAALLFVGVAVALARLSRKSYARANADGYCDGYSDSNQDGPEQPPPSSWWS
jgi:hypothetical protein